MDAVFTVRITSKDRDALVLAAEAMAEEYKYISDQARSQSLARSFRNEAAIYDNLASLFKGLVNRTAVNEMVSRELAAGNKINAIKGVRMATTMGLKEAKDYVDNFKTTPDYGVGII